MLCSILRLAHRGQLIKHAVYENVQNLEKSKKDPDPLLPEEYPIFIKNVPTHTATLWAIAIYTGMRHGELCALAWEDVDLVKGEVHIKRNITNKGVFVPPKTDAGIRTITLMKSALEAMREQFKVTGALTGTAIAFQQREFGKTEQQKLRFVFVPRTHSRKNAGYYFKQSLRYSWEQGLEKAGLHSRVPYQSRHTFA